MDLRGRKKLSNEELLICTLNQVGLMWGWSSQGRKRSAHERITKVCTTF